MLGILLFDMSYVSALMPEATRLPRTGWKGLLQEFTNALAGKWEAVSNPSRKQNWEFIIKKSKRNLGDKLYGIVCKMLQLEPQDRPSAAELTEMLADIASLPGPFPWSHTTKSKEYTEREALLRSVNL